MNRSGCFSPCQNLRLLAFGWGISMLFACGSSVPEGRIQIKNDSQDREYNVLEVSAGASHFSLNPGESGLVPKGTRRIRFARRYAKYTRRYEIECPGTIKDGISIKLIDVHLGRMAGGCKTIFADKG